MKPSVGLLPCLLAAGLALAQDGAPPAEGPAARSPEALEVLKLADAAARAVQTVRFHVSRQPAGGALQYGSPAEGEVVLVGWADGAPAKYWAHVKGSREGQPIELTAGGDGETYFLIDHTQKKAYQDMDPAVLGSTGRSLVSMGIIEFVHPTPFEDELNADQVQLLGEETIGGEPCHTIRVRYAGGREESIWLFSKRDHLPRRRVRLLDIPGREPGSVETTVSRLEVNVTPDSALFRLKLPEGYERVDDFAP